jgi:probable rRNA maturation factor
VKYKINVYNDTDRLRLPVKSVRDSITKVFEDKNRDIAEVRIIYVESERMTQINEEYLRHIGTTDVITFELGEDDTIDGEIYICADVAEENANLYKSNFKEELLRYAVHGALHLVGYDDNTEDKRNKMHVLENKYIGI